MAPALAPRRNGLRVARLLRVQKRRLADLLIVLRKFFETFRLPLQIVNNPMQKQIKGDLNVLLRQPLFIVRGQHEVNGRDADCHEANQHQAEQKKFFMDGDSQKGGIFKCRRRFMRRVG